MASHEGAEELGRIYAARTFVSDAYEFFKFIGYSEEAAGLVKRAAGSMDDGTVALGSVDAASAFIGTCAALRFWKRGS